MSRKPSAQDVAEALATLHKHLTPGTTVYTILRHRSRSGVYRVLDLYVMELDPSGPRIVPLRLSWSAATALGWRYDRKHEGVGVNGCGMDVGFHLVSSLSYHLHGAKPHGPDAERASLAGRPFAPTAEQWRAGYSLRHEWL